MTNPLSLINDGQRKLLYDHLDKHEQVPYERTAEWLTKQFGVVITAQDVTEFFIDQMLKC